jgi:hypothetical protein
VIFLVMVVVIVVVLVVVLVVVVALLVLVLVLVLVLMVLVVDVVVDLLGVVVVVCESHDAHPHSPDLTSSVFCQVGRRGYLDHAMWQGVRGELHTGWVRSLRHFIVRGRASSGSPLVLVCGVCELGGGGAY